MSQQASSDSVSQTGSVSKSLSKPQGGFSALKPLISLQQTSFQKIKSKYIFKTTFENILTMEEGLYHENPSIAASKSFPPNWYYKHWNLAKPQSYYAAILEIINYVKFKHFKLHSDHTEPTYSICIIHKVIHPIDWGQPYINLSPSPCTSVQAPRTSILPIRTGIINRHGSMPSSYKIKTIAILGFSTSIVPRIL